MIALISRNSSSGKRVDALQVERKPNGALKTKNGELASAASIPKRKKTQEEDDADYVDERISSAAKRTKSPITKKESKPSVAKGSTMRAKVVHRNSLLSIPIHSISMLGK